MDRSPFEPLALNENLIALAIGPILALFALIHNLLLFIYHLCHFVKSSKKPALHRLSLFSMVVTLYFLVVLFLSEYQWSRSLLKFPPPPHPALDPFSLIPCTWRIRTTALSWCAYKFVFYAFFMERLFSIFRGAPDLDFKAHHVRCSRIVLFGCWASQQGLAYFINGAQSDGDPSICLKDTDEWVLGLVCLGDLVISTTISVMFVRRLLAFDIKTKSSQIAAMPDTATEKDRERKSSSLRTARKSTILGLVGLITSEIAIICIAVTDLPHLWLPMDAVINSWGIMLIFHEYASIYNTMCCCCDRAVSVRCLSCYSCHCCCRIH